MSAVLEMFFGFLLSANQDSFVHILGVVLLLIGVLRLGMHFTLGDQR